MKKTILSILLVVAMLTAMAITVNCADNSSDVPLGDSLDPTIVADSLEDFCEKLQNLKADEMEVFYYNNSIPGTYEKVLERIDSGKDVVYIPDIDLDKMKFTMFIMSYNANYKTGISQKYSMVLHENDEIGLKTSCSFTYGNSSFWIGYDDGDFIAHEEMTVHGRKISYYVGDKETRIFFDLDGEKIGISINSSMTKDEIKALPRGMFYPKVITITDIKNGDYSAASDSAELIVNDPKESYDVERITESEN